MTPKGRERRARLIAEDAIGRMLDEFVELVVYELDPAGVCTAWEPYAPPGQFAPAGERIGQRLDTFFPRKIRESGAYDRDLAIAARTGRCEGDGWRQLRDGTRRRMRFLVEARHDEAGALIGYRGISVDVTAEQQAAERLDEAREALAEARRLQSLGELTGGIAHDFNNLLTVIRGSAELLTRPDFDDAKRERQLRAIIDTADRAAELTGQLLAFARRQPLQPRRIDLNEQISDMIDLLGRTLGGQVAIETRLAKGLWPVTADPAQLHSVILNAAINARDAINGQGAVTLITENIASRDGDFVRLAIVDDGKGMSEEIRARVFEPFFTTKPVGEGTGLGLSQAYGFAAQSGGRIEVDSAPGEGATLSLYLPRAAGRAITSPAPASRAAGDAPHGTRVLLVEDSRIVAAFAQALLEEIGCYAVHAHNAEEALAALDEEAFDIVFSDIVMPGLSGLELAARLRAERPRLPILLATAYSEAAARGEGGEFPILAKPYRREALARMIGETIETSRLSA